MTTDNDKIDSAETTCSAVSRKQAVLLVLVLALVWMGLGLGDWFFRFQRFRWHDTLIITKSSVVNRGPDAPMQTHTIEAHSGGDLTSLTGLTDFNVQFEETRPDTIIKTDEYGYRNEPPTDGRYYPIVLAGDSFMFQSYETGTGFDRQLSKYAGLPVYNYAFPGRGPTWSLTRFLVEDRFTDRLPKVVVWGFIERDVSGESFGGMVYQLWRKDNPEKADEVEPDPDTIAWARLAPSALRKELPNTSLLGAVSKRIWNQAQYRLFSQVTSDVEVSKPLPSGNRTLFYRLALESMRWPQEIRRADSVIWSITYIHNYFKELGVELMIVMIPDKEQVYREYLPDHILAKQPPLQPPVFDEISAKLDEHGVPYVNLLPVFKEAAASAPDLYWNDDTHWKPYAIDLAAAAAWSKLQTLLPVENNTGDGHQP